MELLDTVVAGDGLVDVDGHGPDVGGEASTALDEAGDGGELLVGGGGGDGGGVEEETEEGGLAGAPASDHESVAGGGLEAEPVDGLLGVAREVVCVAGGARGRGVVGLLAACAEVVAVHGGRAMDDCSRPERQPLVAKGVDGVCAGSSGWCGVESAVIWSAARYCRRTRNQPLLGSLPLGLIGGFSHPAGVNHPITLIIAGTATLLGGYK